MRRRGARQVRLNIHTMFIFPHTPPPPRADSRSQTQGLDSSFEFRKVAFINCFNSCVRSLPCSASLQVTEEVLSSRPGGRFLRETRLLRLLSAFGARFPTTRGGSRGTTRGRDDTVAPLQPPFQRTFRTACPPARPPRPGEGPASFPAPRRQRQHSSLGHTFAREQRCVPSLRQSCLARLSSSSSPTLL